MKQRALATQINRLKKIFQLYNESAATEKCNAIRSISRLTLYNHTIVVTYHNLLIFLLTHPDNEMVYSQAVKEMQRVCRHLKKAKNGMNHAFEDTGLPYTKMTVPFSHDLLHWLINSNGCVLSLDSFEKDAVELNTALSLTLPSILREETTAGLDNMELLGSLGINHKNALTFLLNEFSKLNETPFIKDHIWDSVKPIISLKFCEQQFSKSYNRISNAGLFYHAEILRSFDHAQLLNKPLPQYEKSNDKRTNEIITVIRRSMVLTMRETDTSTYMDPATLRLYHLERGISIAIYGMTANRQMPLQSYIGYTLFKNGFPLAYGGSWVFGSYALFGLNIFEIYRGAESGFIMCQLLRVYKQVFRLNYIEIEAYQFGKDNPEGIQTGAFWFYYRYGFRPIDKQLNKLASKEYEKIKTKKGYRSGEKILLQLAESNMALHTGGPVPEKTDNITGAVKKMIAKSFKGDFKLASGYCIHEFYSKTGNLKSISSDTPAAIEEMAFWTSAFRVNDKTRLAYLKEMADLKPKDPYLYNDTLIKFMEKNK